MFYKIGVLKSFANSTGKNLCRSLFLNNVGEPAKPATLIKGDSNTVVFL